MDFPERICRLCLKKSVDYEAIAEYEKVLEEVLLKIDLSVSEEPVMCTNCAKMMMKCHDFKEKCFDTRKYIATFINDNAGVKLDLKNVYLSKHGNDVVFLEDQEICGFCMGLVENCSDVSMRDKKEDFSLEKTLENFLPELDFGFISKLVICAACRASLQDYFSFVTNYLIVEELIKKHCQATDVNDKGQIKLNDLLQLTFQNMFTHMEHGGEPSRIKIEQICEVNDSENMECDGHYIKLKDQNVNDVYQLPSKCTLSCEEDGKEFDLDKIKEEFACELETKIENVDFDEINEEFTDVLKSEMEIEESCVETKKQIFSSCDNEAIEADIEKHNIDRSQNGIVPPPHVLMEKLSNHNNHQRNIQHGKTHENSSEATAYTCNLCSFKSKHRSSLRKHMVVHKNPSEVPMYTCDLCPYKSIYKANIRKHTVVHKSLSETPIYTCNSCSFKSKYKKGLLYHMVTHKSPSETPMYTCDLCSYKSKRKETLTKHMTIHSEMLVYTCDSCPFTTKHKRSLRRHMLSHERLEKG